MNVFFKKKLVTPFVTLLIIAVTAGGTWGICELVAISALQQTSNQTELLTAQQLYERSVLDAMIAEAGEAVPVVAITPQNDMVTWNDAGDRVLMLSYHRFPDSYPDGEDVTLAWGEVWAFTDREIVEWYKANGKGVTDWPLRLKQLIGLPPDKEYTHMTAFWVSPNDMVRPAYEPDITASQVGTSFSQEPTAEFKEWFDGNIVYSYYDSAYPWTRLGYTYDWADNGTAYGLSEFLIREGAETTVEFTLSTDEFAEWLQDEATELPNVA